jgi:putative acetyltransferase
VISIDDPRAPDVHALLERHAEWARAQTPPEDAHALDPEELAEPGVAFFSCRRAGELLGVAALKPLDARHAEVKSMHTVEPARGTGVGAALLEHLLGVARESGFERVSLETGAMESFAAARALYSRAGFRECEPFGDYRHSRNSVYMTLELT